MRLGAAIVKQRSVAEHGKPEAVAAWAEGLEDPLAEATHLLRYPNTSLALAHGGRSWSMQVSIPAHEAAAPRLAYEPRRSTLPARHTARQSRAIAGQRAPRRHSR